MKEFTETWLIHNRINLYLLQSISEEHLSDKVPSGGRTVQEQWAHVHNVRLLWLKVAAPDLLDGLEKLEKGGNSTKETLTLHLAKSGEAIATLLDQAWTSGKVKGFKPSAAAFLGYLISHESHHRGQIVLTLKIAGHPVDKNIAFGLWEWGSR